MSQPGLHVCQMQHVFVSHLDAATNPDAATAFHAAHESHATLLVLGTHIRHELLGNAEVLGNLLVCPRLLGSMLGSVGVSLGSPGMGVGLLFGSNSLLSVLQGQPETPPPASLLVMVLGDARMMTSDLAVSAGPLDVSMSLGGVCFRSLGMSLCYFRGVLAGPGVGMGSFLEVGSLLGHVLVAPLGFPAAVGEANALDVAPQTEGLLVLGQSSLRNHVFS